MSYPDPIKMFGFKNIPKNIKGRRVFLRVDFNMPLGGRDFGDDFRFERTLPTIKLLQKKGAVIILASHWEIDGRYPSFKKLEKFFSDRINNFSFSGAITGERVYQKTRALPPSSVLMLENLRLHPGEKKNSSSFADSLSRLADLYINEAFSASHRTHASIVGLPRRLPAYAGPLFIEEVKNLSRAFRPERPFVFILGGKKFSTKEPILEKFIAKADNVFIGGGMAALLLYCRGRKPNVSGFSEKELTLCAKIKNSKKVMPIFDVVAKKGNNKTVLNVKDLEGEKIYDIGTESLKEIEKVLRKAGFVLWNGPLGWIEGGFTEGTFALAKILASLRARTVVGGGDTVAFLKKFKLAKKFSFLSTAGGAMLGFLAKGTLPGIEALKK